MFYSVFPFAISFAKLSRYGFFLAASMCMKRAFASFRGSSWKESPGLPSIHILKLLFLNSSSSCFPYSFSTWPSTASSRSQWALPDLNGEHQLSVPNCKQSPDLSGHCYSLIKFLWCGPSQLVRAFADLSRSFRETFADFRARSREICE